MPKNAKKRNKRKNTPKKTSSSSGGTTSADNSGIKTLISHERLVFAN
jgi:hypothetical protein